jgi:hypothetical protein
MDNLLLWIAPFAPLFSFGSFIYARFRHFKELLADAEYRRAKAEALREPGFWRLYLRGLDESLKWLQRHFGHPLSPQALGVCLTVGLLYGVVFLLIAWGLGAPATLQTTVLLPDVAQPGRALWALAGLAWLTAILWLVIRREEVDRAVLGWLGRRLGAAYDSWRARLTLRLLVAVIVAALLVGISWLVLGQLGRSATEGVVILFFVNLALAGVLIVAGIDAGAVAMLIGIGAFSGDVSSAAALGLLLFYLVLPTVNALWDWLSWWVSRRLGHGLHALLAAGRNTAVTALLALGLVALDLVAALTFLALLAWTLPLVIDGFNAFAAWWQGIPPPLPLASFLCDSARAPLGAGLWATLLLFSTLVPTALHMMVVVASPVAAAAARIPGVQTFANEMEAANPSVTTLTRAAWRLALWRPVACLIGIAVTILLGWGLFRLIGAVAEPVPEILLALALRDPDAAARCLATVTLPLPP